LALAFLGVAAGAAAYVFLLFAPRERARAIDRWRDQLSSMADDRRFAVDRWLSEGLGHARTLSDYPSLRLMAAGGSPVSAGPGLGAALGSHVRVVLASVVANEGFRTAAVLDATGRVLVAAGEEPRVRPDGEGLFRRAREAAKPLADLRRQPDGQPYVEFVAPIRAQGSDRRAVGVVLLTMDPEPWLYPLLRHQPLASATLETLLVRREGEQLVSLSPSRERADAALDLRWSTAAGAALAEREGFDEIVDPRGQVVLAATRRLSSAPWALVAKVDRAEALAGVRSSVLLAGLALAGLLVGFAAAIVSVWLLVEARGRARLVRSEARFSVLLDQASDAILLVGAEGRIREANRRAAELYGYSREALCDLHVWQLRRDQSRTAVERRSQEIRAQGEQVWESVHVTRDGREIPVEVAAKSVELDGERVHVSIIRDVAERRRVEQALRESEARYRSLFEANQDAVILAVQDGRLLDANPAAAAVFGWSREQLRTMRREDFLDPADARLAPALELRSRTGRFSGQLRFRRRDGSLFEGEASSVLIPTQGGEVRASLVVRDVTERLRAEQEIRRLNADLERRVAERTAELEAFSYSVSHDLRAPLRAIGGFSRILETDHAGRLDAEGLRLLGTIRDSAQRMDLLIADLLALSRIGRRELERTTVSMETLVADVVRELVGDRLPERVQLGLDPLPAASGDPVMLRQVWANLLSNALKFTSGREQARIRVTGRAQGQEAVYSVQDNGVGFDVRQAGKLFGVFQRLHSLQEFPGNGIGLALVQRIVRRHGGRVWADATAGEGATFSFALPLPTAPPRS
jgi:PAS domain S-box-containing protein